MWARRDEAFQAELAARFADLADRIDGLARRIDDVEAKCRAAQADMAALRQEKPGIESAIADLRDGQDEIRSDVTALRGRQDDAAHDLDALRQRIEEIGSKDSDGVDRGRLWARIERIERQMQADAGEMRALATAMIDLRPSARPGG